MPMCMSRTGANSGLPVVHVPSAATVTPVGFMFASTQLGVTRRVMRSGMARARNACLSPMEAELSISKSKSTLSMADSAIDAVKLVRVMG